MKKTIIFISILIGFFSISFYSCIKDELDFDRFSDRIELRPGFIGPVAYGRVSLQDLLEEAGKDSLFQQDSTGLLYLCYAEELVSIEGSEIVDLPSQFYDQFFIRSDISAPSIIDSVVITKSKNFMYNTSGDEVLDSMILKSGFMTFDITSSFLHTGILKIWSNNVTLGNQIFLESFPISSADGNFRDTRIFDLSGYTLVFNDDGGSPVIPFEFSLTLYDSGQPLRATDSVIVDVSLTELDYYVVYGYMGYKSLIGQEGNVPISIFRNDLQGNIEFANPRFEIIVDNSYGIPVSIELTDVIAYNQDSSEQIVTFPPEDNPIFIEYPSINEIGQTQTTHISFANTTPSIGQIISNNPGEISFVANGYTDTTQPDKRNFILDTSKLVANIEVDLPLHFRAGNYPLTDTANLNLADILEDVDIVEELTMWLTIDNGFPVDAYVQFYFLNSNYEIVDSVFTNSTQIINSGIIDENFRVVETTSLTTEISLTNDIISNLDDVTYLLFKADITTTDFYRDNDLKVKIYADYYIGFNAALKAKFLINPDNINTE